MMESDDKPVYEQRFNAAVKVIKNLPSNGSFQPSNEMMLKFYSYYKQATQGPCDTPRPGFWDPVGKVKWDAWHGLGDMPKEEAMTAYVEDLKLILESMPMTEEVEQLLQIIGPFYELVDERKKISQVSDLTTGLGSMMSAPSKGVTKSIIKTMQMNGTLDSHAPEQPDVLKTDTYELKEQQDNGDEDDDCESDEENEKEEETEQVKKGPAQKKKVSKRKAKGLLNGSIGHTPMTNGRHDTKSTLNGNHEDMHDEATHHINDHTTDDNVDVCSALHVASDSDSEVYCDSVDQFGAEENSEAQVKMSLEENHSSVCSLEEPSLLEEEIMLSGQEGVQYGGEDGKKGEGEVQRPGLNTDRAGSSLIRRRRGSRSPGSDSGSGLPGSLHGAGGDGERWGSDRAAGVDLNEQIVTALTRLQEDMQSVLERLHTLEALTASQARSAALSSEHLLPAASRTPKKPSWWVFDISPGTVAFALIWPFIAQWLIHLYFQRRRRKFN
ncbi:acyl-CoA-binding domain-containing protein 5A isoform X2 [Trichomycterus rosablanca]|uniref:acyl-CoA-binding domain-containing protein 5A isoform X2 n=1 Tax=Trichomycterus rosablanca TaxID=2290929 RepID=UPI002F35B6D4